MYISNNKQASVLKKMSISGSPNLPRKTSNSPNKPGSPNLDRNHSNLSNQVFLNEVEEKLKAMRQRRLNRLNAFVDEQSKFSEERNKPKQTYPISTSQETLPPKKNVATIKSRPSFRAVAEKTMSEKLVKSAPTEKNKAKESEVKSEENKEEMKKSSSTKKLISKFNCVSNNDLTDESASRSSVYIPSNKLNTFTVENKHFPDSHIKSLQRKTISFPDDFSLELHNKSQLMKNRIHYKSIEALNTENKLQSETKSLDNSTEALLNDKQTPKLVKIEPPKISGQETLKLTKLQPPKMSKTETPKIIQVEPPKITNIEVSKLNKIEHSNVTEIEHSQLTTTKPPKLPQTELPKLPKTEPPREPKLEFPKVNDTELQRLINMDPEKPTKAQSSTVNEAGRSKITPESIITDPLVCNWSLTLISGSRDDHQHQNNRSPTPISSITSKSEDEYQEYDRAFKLPMVTFGKSTATSPIQKVLGELPIPKDMTNTDEVEIKKESRKLTPKPGKKFLSLPAVPDLVSKKLNREEKILKKFQINCNTVRDILDNNSDVDDDEIEDLKHNLYETEELVTEYKKLITKLESRKALSNTKEKLDKLRTQFTCTTENVTKFKGLRRDAMYNEISSQLAHFAAEIERYPGSKEEKKVFLNEINQCVKSLEAKIIKHEKLLQELIFQQVELIGNRCGLVQRV